MSDDVQVRLLSGTPWRYSSEAERDSHKVRVGGSSPSIATNPNRRINMESVIIEIKAAEGGADSRLLVTDMLEVYVAAGTRRRV